VEERPLKAILESLLFAAGEPVSLARLGNALESVSRDTIRQALTEMTAAYLNDGRGIVLEEIAGGYQLRTPSAHAPYIRRLLSAKPPRLSRPLLETLSIIAYRRQVTRPEIEQLRGVDTGGVLETLLERSLIRIAGRKDAPGRPIFYETTPGFLELFGFKNLEELPDLEEFRAIEGSLADALAGSDEQAAALVPSEAAQEAEAAKDFEMFKDGVATTNHVIGENKLESAPESASAVEAVASGQPSAPAVPSPDDHES
jgi:segregation and condensation protein B